MTTPKDIFKLERSGSYTREVGWWILRRWQTDVTYTFNHLTYSGHLGKIYNSELTEDEIRKTCNTLGFEFSDHRNPHIFVNDKNMHNLEYLCKTLTRLNLAKQQNSKSRCLKQEDDQKIVDEIEQKNIAAMQLKDVYCSREEGS
jgi:hypothetical protein